MTIDDDFANSELLDRICDLADRVQLGGGNGTSLNHLRKPGVSRAGEGLELWVKHFLAGTIGFVDDSSIQAIWDNKFSFHGGTNNPPDVMLRNSIAAEVKKTEGKGGTLQLNSSWPIRTLHCDDLHIAKKCRDAEAWAEKPFLLFVGRIDPTANNISALWIIDGRCLSDNEEVYQSLVSQARSAMLLLGSRDTKEIGQFAKLDTRGRTLLRVRPMFSLDHPATIFSTFFHHQTTEQFALDVLIPELAYDSFTAEDRRKLENADQGIVIKRLDIPDPTNKESNMRAVHISGAW